ncbi:hypothetical protein PROFUN_14770, partial [Planoprotostelium fungivorum]
GIIKTNPMRLHQGHSGPNQGPTNLKPRRNEEEKGTEEEKRVLSTVGLDSIQNLGQESILILLPVINYRSCRYCLALKMGRDESILPQVYDGCSRDGLQFFYYRLCIHSLPNVSCSLRCSHLQYMQLFSVHSIFVLNMLSQTLIDFLVLFLISCNSLRFFF